MSKRWPLFILSALLLFAFAAPPADALSRPALQLAPQAASPLYLRTTTKVKPKAICNPDAFTLCLQSDRFEVTATWDTNTGQSGDAQVVKLTADTGYLWFFGPDNVEVVVKVIDACGFSNSFWFFAGGLTNVHVVITLTDDQTGLSNTYESRRNTAFQPIQDTNAFNTCP